MPWKVLPTRIITRSKPGRFSAAGSLSSFPWKVALPDRATLVGTIETRRRIVRASK